MSSDLPVILVTDPGPFLSIDGGTSAWLKLLDDTLSSYDLCGRSWQGQPQDLMDFVFNTFKPIFCAGRKVGDQMPSDQFLSKVDWFLVTSDGDFHKVCHPALKGHPTSFHESLLKARLLVLASAGATRSLLDSSVRAWYHGQVERNSSDGRDSSIYLKDVGLISDSPLASLDDGVRNRIEVVVLPSPSKRGSKIFFIGGGGEGDTFSDLRINYLRRVHMLLGCDKHSIW